MSTITPFTFSHDTTSFTTYTRSHANWWVFKRKPMFESELPKGEKFKTRLTERLSTDRYRYFFLHTRLQPLSPPFAY